MYFLAVLCSAVLHPFMAGLTKKAANPLTLNFWGICLSAVFFAPFFLDFGFLGKVSEHRELIILSGLFHFFYILLVLPLISKHEFQVMYPLTRLAPIFILIGELFLLGTEFSQTQIFGIFSIILGALIFGFDRKIDGIRTKILFEILILTFLVAGFHLTDKKLLEFFSPSEMWAMVVFQAPFFMFLFWTQKSALLADLKNVKNLALYTLLMVGTWWLALFALQSLDAAVVASVRNLSILFGIFVGARLFAEGHKFWRYMAAVLIVGGAIILV